MDAVAGLPDLEEIFPEYCRSGFPEDFSKLFARSELRLLRSAFRGRNVLLVFRSRDLRAVATHPAVGVQDEFRVFQRFNRNAILAKNPPVHGPMRQVFARPLSPARIAHLRSVATRIVNELVAGAVREGEIDFCSQFSERLTARFWGELFGMTDDEMEQLADTVRGIGPALLLDLPEESIAEISAAMDSYLNLMAGAIHRCLRTGGHELLDAMALEFAAMEQSGGTGGLEEMIAANLVEGVHTAAVACSNVVFQLLQAPGGYASARADVALVPNVYSEGLRLAPPVIHTQRLALQDFTIGDVWIPSGTTLTLLWAAGNRDPDVFREPNQYDLRRGQRGDSTFGSGIHICPGRHMAGVLARVMLEALLASDIRIRPSGDDPVWIARSSMRQLQRMNVVIERV